MTCPTDDDLVRLVERVAGDATIAGIEAHVDGCARCAAVVAGLGAMNTGPRTVARYQLDRRIAAGGMGEVWAAWDPELRRTIAIKLVHPEHADDERERERLLREARALARLAHPNVLAVYDVGVERGEVWIATELVSGDTLVSRAGGDWRPLVPLYVQAARGLAAAHAAGLVHRDVKPANLLVGADARVRVADFGLALPVFVEPALADGSVSDTERSDGPRVTATGRVAGTPAYMAPEQRAGKPADARADQYALCVALTEAIAGRRPPVPIDDTALVAFVGERRDVDAALADVCGVLARGLARDPAARHADMTALADALERATAAPTASPRRRARWPIAIGGLAIAGVAIAAWAYSASRDSMTVSNASPPAAKPAPDASVAPTPPANDVAPAVVAPKVVAAPPPPRVIAKPPARVPKPPPAAPANPAEARERFHNALYGFDVAGCRAALPALPADEAALDAGLCDMIAGDCAGGSQKVGDALHNPAGATAFADQLCPIEGDFATRLHRMGVRTGRMTLSAASCMAMLPAARALARDASSQIDKTSVATVLANLARCVGAARRCDDARAILTEATALQPAITTDELPSACR